jgi:hypothetical protein
MSNYTKTVNFASKDALTTGDSNKIVKGTEIDTEFNNIATAIATKLESSGALGTPTSGVVTNLTGTASININGTVGATTANTGAFTTATITTATTTTVTASSAALIGATAQISPYGAKALIVFDPATEQGITLKASSGTFTGNPVTFINSSNAVSGSIAQTTSTIAYLTTSDYRAKNTITPMTGALSKVALLKPCTYKWNADGTDSQGFIAHELQEVVKECVVGEKDATNADGSPKLQGVDTSFLVATLTAAIQELKALVDAQAARITALETP